MIWFEGFIFQFHSYVTMRWYVVKQQINVKCVSIYLERILTPNESKSMPKG